MAVHFQLTSSTLPLNVCRVSRSVDIGACLSLGSCLSLATVLLGTEDGILAGVSGTGELYLYLFRLYLFS